jgi:acetyl esterase/lipase
MFRLLATTITLVLILVLPVNGQERPSAEAVWPLDLMMNYSVTPNITYAVGNNIECKLDVYARRGPDTGPFPTVVQIHGGGWVAGSKEGSVMSIFPYLAMGFSAVNVEYRLARVSLAPAAVEDCRLALRWVFKNAKAYGFDTSRVIITGGSAGGHLALMTGMLTPEAGLDAPREWDQAPLPVSAAAIVNWFGITDVKDLLAGANRQQYAVSWFGSQPDRDQSAVRLSPLTYVRKGAPPTLTIHGDNDNLVPYSHAVRLHRALTEAGVPNLLVTIPGGKHGGFSRDHMVSAYATIREFLTQHGILRTK